MTALLLVAAVLIFAMAAAGVWLMRRAEAEPAARAVGRAPDPAEEDEARQTVSTPRSSILQDPEQRPSGGRARE
jgi:cytochrome c-type biogenesis protein CcmH/NrfG